MTIRLTDELANTKGIFVGGPMDRAEGIAEGAITPGAVVMRDDATGEIKPATAAADHGVLGYALENMNPADTTGTASDLRGNFADNKMVPFNRAHGSRFMGIMLSGSAAIVRGDLLKTAAGGKLEKWVSGTDDGAKAVARYVGMADVGVPGADTYILCRWGVA